MKRLVLLFSILLVLGCKKEDVTPTGYAWLDTEIKNGSEDTHGKFESIYSYLYLDKRVVLINYETKCCDMFTAQLFDENGTSLCFPYGGISGKGDLKCQEFDINKKAEKLIWKN
ncbi:MAG: hypothetical protein V4683_12835 [Bacteroidota bacterium]